MDAPQSESEMAIWFSERLIILQGIRDKYPLSREHSGFILNSSFKN